MADNVTVTTVGGNRDIATDEVSSVHYQRVKQTWGADGAVGDTSAANPLPVQMYESGSVAVGLVAKIGATDEGAAGSDTATSGLNGLLKRIAQNLTSVIAAINGIAGGTAVLTHPIVTAGSTNAASVLAAEGYLRGITGFNRSGRPVKICFHNTAGTPTAGTSVVFQRVVQAGAHIDLVFPGLGRHFSTGIGRTVVAIDAAADMATTGATATAANDAQFEVLYEAA